MYFCERIVEKGLSVRQMEQFAVKRSAKRVGARAAADRDIIALEEKLQHCLGTKVRIHHGKKRGKIEIEYYSLEDLDRVLKLVGI